MSHIPAHLQAILSGSIRIAPGLPMPAQQGAPKAPRTQAPRGKREPLELPELEAHELGSVGDNTDMLSFSWCE